MFSFNRKGGFTLFEVIIAVALVAIMAVAIAPPLIKNLKQGKVARAQSDAQVLGNAILDFYKDVGDFPLNDDADDQPELMRLVGNASLGGGNTGIPGGMSGVAGAQRWANRDPAGTLTDHLIKNKSATVDPLYPRSTNPHVQPGWDGPYLDRIPLDPWGNPFVVNVRYGHPLNSGGWAANNERHTIMVVSAGPNKVFETTFDDATFNENFGGDDVGYVIRGSNQQ